MINRFLLPLRFWSGLGEKTKLISSLVFTGKARVSEVEGKLIRDRCGGEKCTKSFVPGWLAGSLALYFGCFCWNRRRMLIGSMEGEDSSINFKADGGADEVMRSMGVEEVPK